jgi:hypothetical protein
MEGKDIQSQHRWGSVQTGKNQPANRAAACIHPMGCQPVAYFYMPYKLRMDFTFFEGLKNKRRKHEN